VEEWQEAKRERWVAFFIGEGHSLGGGGMEARSG